jgi:hypothetical protein
MGVERERIYIRDLGPFNLKGVRLPLIRAFRVTFLLY